MYFQTLVLRELPQPDSTGCVFYHHTRVFSRDGAATPTHKHYKQYQKHASLPAVAQLFEFLSGVV